MIRIEHAVPVLDASAVALARREVAQCSAALRLSDSAAARAALVATELATNLVKHGGGGAVLCGTDSDEPILALIAIDSGRGLVNLNQAMQDGYSTAGSPGTGLGAIVRAASSIDVYAAADRGTAILALVSDVQIPRTPVMHHPSRMLVGGIAIPKKGEEVCGDAWTASLTRERATLCVADGLGHGPGAATASAGVVRVVSREPHAPLDQLMQDAHGALRPTRGAAVGIARIEMNVGRLDFAGVGNIAGTIVDEAGSRRTLSINGIVGHEMRRLQTYSYPWTGSSVLVLQSDGLSANWNPVSYPGLMQHEPALIAAVLYRDHCRGTDDATIVVARAG